MFLTYYPTTSPKTTGHASHINVKFVKILSKAFSLNTHDGPGIIALVEQKKILRTVSGYIRLGIGLCVMNRTWIALTAEDRAFTCAILDLESCDLRLVEIWLTDRVDMRDPIRIP